MATLLTPEQQVEMAQQNAQPDLMGMIGATLTNPIFLLFLLLLIILIVVGVIIFMRNKKEDALRERDDINYAIYKQTLRDCSHNAEPNWVSKSYSLLNLLILGIPIFWNEHSLKILDFNENLLGYYRGHKVTPRGETIYMCYKTKSWLIFENLILIRCLYTHDHEEVKEVMNKETKKMEKQKVFHKENYEHYYQFFPKETNRKLYRYLKIQCDGISENAYMHIPNYLVPDGSGNMIAKDFRPEYLINNSYYQRDEQFWRMVTDMSRNVEQASRSNPYISQGRHIIEKTEEEKRIDDMTPNQDRKL
jgi:hypothetical protein